MNIDDARIDRRLLDGSDAETREAERRRDKRRARRVSYFLHKHFRARCRRGRRRPLARTCWRGWRLLAWTRASSTRARSARRRTVSRSRRCAKSRTWATCAAKAAFSDVAVPHDRAPAPTARPRRRGRRRRGQRGLRPRSAALRGGGGGGSRAPARLQSRGDQVLDAVPGRGEREGDGRRAARELADGVARFGVAPAAPELEIACSRLSEPGSATTS